MKYLRPFAIWIVLASLVSSSVSPLAEAQSMDFRSRNTSQQIANDLQNFINSNSRYREELRKKQKEAEKSQSDAPAADLIAAYLSSSNNELEQLINDQQLATDRPVAALAAQLAKAKGDGTPGGNFARSALTAVSFGRYLSPEKHNVLLATLLADYLEHPKDRQAIDAVIRAWGPEVEDDIKASYQDPYTEWVEWGMGWTWVAIVIWDWRDGAKGIKEDGKNLISAAGRGRVWTANTVRAIRESGIDFTGIGQRFTSLNLSDLPGAAKIARMAKDPAYLKEQMAAVGNALMRVGKKAEGEKRVEPMKMLKGGLEQVQMHAWQIARAMTITGIPLWYLETETRRLRPADGLQSVQAFAVQRLQVQVAELRARFRAYDAKAKDATTEQFQALESDRKAIKDSYDDLQEQYEDLMASKSATIYQADLPWADLDQRLKEFDQKNWFQTRRLSRWVNCDTGRSPGPLDEMVSTVQRLERKPTAPLCYKFDAAQFIQIAEQQRQLGSVLKQVQTEINREKAKQGYSETDSLSYGLTAVGFNLKWIKLGLDQYEAKGEALEAPKTPKKP